MFFCLTQFPPLDPSTPVIVSRVSITSMENFPSMLIDMEKVWDNFRETRKTVVWTRCGVSHSIHRCTNVWRSWWDLTLSSCVVASWNALRDSRMCSFTITLRRPKLSFNSFMENIICEIDFWLPGNFHCRLLSIARFLHQQSRIEEVKEVENFVTFTLIKWNDSESEISFQIIRKFRVLPTSRRPRSNSSANNGAKIRSGKKVRKKKSFPINFNGRFEIFTLKVEIRLMKWVHVEITS